jgi:hypothetical protein
MRYVNLYEFMLASSIDANAKVVVSMPDDPEAVYAVDSIRYNSEKKQLEVVVA